MDAQRREKNFVDLIFRTVCGGDCQILYRNPGGGVPVAGCKAQFSGFRCQGRPFAAFRIQKLQILKDHMDTPEEGKHGGAGPPALSGRCRREGPEDC